MLATAGCSGFRAPRRLGREAVAEEEDASYQGPIFAEGREINDRGVPEQHEQAASESEHQPPLFTGGTSILLLMDARPGRRNALAGTSSRAEARCIAVRGRA
jgi:hypothetical protein